MNTIKKSKRRRGRPCIEPLDKKVVKGICLSRRIIKEVNKIKKESFSKEVEDALKNHIENLSHEDDSAMSDFADTFLRGFGKK